MDEVQIWDRLTGVFRETFDDDELVVGPSTTAGDLEGWDSVTHIELLVALEAAFGVRFNIGEVAKLANVGEMVSLIGKRVGIRGPSD